MLTKFRCRVPHFKEMKTLQKCIQKHGTGKTDVDSQWGEKEICSVEAKAVEDWLDKRYKRSGWGKGAFRAAFVLNDRCILKVPHSLGGAGHQLEEIKTWERAKTNPLMRKWLLPVLSYGKHGEWLTMPRIGTERDWKGSPDWYMKVANAKRQIESEKLLCPDLHEGNWGFKKDGTMVSIDYGFGCRILKEGESTQTEYKWGMGFRPNLVEQSSTTVTNVPITSDLVNELETSTCPWRCTHGSKCIGNKGHKTTHWSPDGCNSATGPLQTITSNQLKDEELGWN